MKVILHNGAKLKECFDPCSDYFIDDWKPESRIIICTAIRITYATAMIIYTDENEVSYPFDEDLLCVDGIYYGDIVVEAE